MRVFHDRLTTDEDRDYFKKLLVKQFSKFNLTETEVIDSERIIFGDFMQGREVDPKSYTQITDLGSLLNKMDVF